MSKTKKVTNAVPNQAAPKTSVQTSADDSEDVGPEHLANDAHTEGQSAVSDMLKLWGLVCNDVKGKKPSYEIAELLSKEVAARWELFLWGWPTEWRSALSKDFIRGVAYEIIRAETDYLTA